MAERAGESEVAGGTSPQDGAKPETDSRDCTTGERPASHRAPHRRGGNMNGNDAKEQAANTAHVHAVEQAAAQALVEEKESESRFRHYGKGPWQRPSPRWRWSSRCSKCTRPPFRLRRHDPALVAHHFPVGALLPHVSAWKGERRSPYPPTLFDACVIAAGCSRSAISSSIIRKSPCAAAISCPSTTSWPPSA